MLDIQRHTHAKPRQVGDQMKDMPLDPAEAVQREDHASEHGDA
jgi:hypothetical protein